MKYLVTMLVALSGVNLSAIEFEANNKGYSFHSRVNNYPSNNAQQRMIVKKIPSTGQYHCYGDLDEITCPKKGEDFYGQDAQFPSAQSFKDNGDGTVTDFVTGLTWQKTQDKKMTWDEAKEYAAQSRLGGKDDWRVPTITELFSLISFSGYFGRTANDSIPFINTKYFDFAYSDGTDIKAGEGGRWIDVQNWSSTRYNGSTANSGDKAIFGVNFADGRIKAYPQYSPRSNNTMPRYMYVRLVRGDSNYGIPKFHQGPSGTIIDDSTSLMWQKSDDGELRNWQDALSYCVNLSLGGYNDWRLPNVKELQYIVDYSRSPTKTNSAAIYPIFEISNIESYFWTSTTILEGPQDRAASSAAYIAFGRALGYFEMPPRSGHRSLVDVHGAGAQRASFKSGDPSSYPQGHGPQGDDVRIYHNVRCVRDVQ